MQNKIIGITAGSMDLLHLGHIIMLEECKEQCDYLIICLQTNPTIDRPDSKNKPIQSVFERYMQLRACKYIDQIIVYETESELYNILSTIKFDKRFIGADWIGKEFTGKDISKGEIIYNERNHKFSTTELRQRICKAGNKWST